MADDIISTLTGPSWRGIPFPLTSLENGFTHQHVEHTFVYRDGMHIETTGRNGLSFLGHVPFNNGIRPGNMEAWAGQELYPTLFKKFLDACLDGSTGELVHPDFGPIKCKARDCTWRYTSNARDGAEISVRWYETVEDIDNPDLITTRTSATGEAQRASSTLDQQLAAMPPLPENSNDGDSFVSMLADFRLGNGGLGRMNSKLENTRAALDRLDDVNNWQTREATESLRASLITLGASPGQPLGTPGASKVREYTVPFGSSLAAIGVRLGVQSDSLVTMNPRLARDPYVPAGTRVRYIQIGL